MVYPESVSTRIARALYRRIAGQGDSDGVAANFSCGSFCRFRLAIDDRQVVTGIEIKSSGCGYMLAAGDVIAEDITGRELRALSGLRNNSLLDKVTEALGPLPAGREECVEAVIQALAAAFADHRAKKVEEFGGEKALICTCFGVSEHRIEAAIKTGKVVSVDGITAICNAGAGCGSCRPLLQEILDAHGYSRI